MLQNLIRSVNKSKNASLKRKMKNRESLKSYLPVKGQYKIAKANAKNLISKERLKYKNVKRGMRLGAAELGDTQNTLRTREKEATNRAQIYAARDTALGQWSAQMNGNPGDNGSSGTSQGKSTTSITKQGYKIEK